MKKKNNQRASGSVKNGTRCDYIMKEQESTPTPSEKEMRRNQKGVKDVLVRTVVGANNTLDQKKKKKAVFFHSFFQEHIEPVHLDRITSSSVGRNHRLTFGVAVVVVAVRREVEPTGRLITRRGHHLRSRR